MEKIIKRVICFIFCAVMLFSIASPSITVEAASSSLPIIYIRGRSTPIYDKDGNKIFPETTSISSVIDDNMSTIVASATKSYTTKNWNYLSDTLYNLIAPLYEEQRLSKDGEITNGSGIKEREEPTKNTSGKYGMFDYAFEYDCRIDPWESAAELRTYINKVLKATGKKKVQIVGRCMGSCILSAYLVRYQDDPKIDTSVFYAAACNGLLLISAPFSGKIQFDSESLKRYASSSSGSGDEIAEMLSSFYSLFGNLGMTLGTKIANSLYSQAAPTILPRLLLATYGTMPGYWSMVGTDYYEDALTNVFGKNARTGSYKKLIEKTDRYKNKVQKQLPTVLKKLKQNGMKINIISKYNVSFDPIYEGCDQQGDGWVELTNMSFGATAAKIDKTLSSSYISTLTSSGCANYISSDKIIDSTTALFPDYTWYIKNMQHSNWASAVNTLLYKIFNSSSQFTVKSSSDYPQFMIYSSGKLSNLYNYQQVLNPTLGTVKLTLTKMVYDGTAKTPDVIVKDTSGKRLVEDTDYTVTYPSKRTAIGKYTVTVKFKGKYKGKAAQKLTYSIVPGNVSVSSTVSGTSATLSWSKVSGATKYRIYLYNSSSKTYTKVADTASTSYKLKNLKAGKTYTYAVKAFKTVSKTDYLSKSYGTTKLYLTPSAPVIKVTAGTKSATISWSKVTGATSYEIFRGNSANGTFRRVATVTTTSYKNESLWTNKTYYYKVRAVKKVNDKTSLTSSFSTIQSVKVK